MDVCKTQQVDVIIPCYQLLAHNKGHFIDLIRSLATAQNRLYIRQIIVINDDVTELIQPFVDAIFEVYKVAEKLIFIQNESCLGQGASRNKGATLAQATYLHFIDQDDFIADNFYAVLLATSADCRLASLMLYRQGKIQKLHRIWTDWWYKKARHLSDLSFFMFANIAVSPGQYVLKRTCFEEVGGFPTLTQKGAEDFGLLFKLCDRTTSFSFVDNALFYHRLHLHQGKNYLNITASVKEFLHDYPVPQNGYLNVIYSQRQQFYFKTIQSKIRYKLFFS